MAGQRIGGGGAGGLPIVNNTTCDVYRAANGPPAAPDVAGVPGYLTPSNRHVINTGTATDGTTVYHTHVLLVAQGTDVRDGWTGSAPGAGFAAGADKVYVPDRTSNVVYRVAEVLRVGRNTAIDHLRVYLIRAAVTWPTQDL